VGRTLGEFEQMILLAMVSLGDDAYGASIRREIAARTGREVSAGAIYTVLDRLERAALISSRVGEPTAERGGRRRKHYVVRAEGARRLREAREVMRRMGRGLDARIGDLLAASGGET